MNTHSLATTAEQRTNGAGFQALRWLFRVTHEHLIDAIQAGRADDAADYARLLAYLVHMGIRP